MKYCIRMYLSMMLIVTLHTVCYAQTTPKPADEYQNQTNQYVWQAQQLSQDARYTEAIPLCEMAIEAEQKSPAPRQKLLASVLINTGACYQKLDRYDKAFAYYEHAFQLYQQLPEDDEFARLLNNRGEVQEAWGQYAEALDSWQQANALFRKLGKQNGVATTLSNIASVLAMSGQFEETLKYAQEALEQFQQLEMNEEAAAALGNIAAAYASLGSYDEALQYYQQASELNRKIKNTAGLARDLSTIGTIYYSWFKDHHKALKSYQEALQLFRTLGWDADIANMLNNIGGTYHTLQQYPEAISFLEESVSLKEQLRKTAPGDVRRDYLQSQIYTYQHLTDCYLRTRDAAKALRTIERSRALLLAERIAGSDTGGFIPTVEQIQRTLPDDSAVLVYANIETLVIVRIMITKEHISIAGVPIAPFIASIDKDYRPIKRTTEADYHNQVIEKFEQLVRSYRIVLINSVNADKGIDRGVVPIYPDYQATVEEMGKSLYKLLLKDTETQLKGKTTLLIVPDGILNFVPFETLLNNDEEYLAEGFQIQYTQSLAVLELIQQRRYDPARKPLLAFGSAVYDPLSYETEKIKDTAKLAELEKQVDAALKRGESMQKIYAALREEQWRNLPGTLQEVKAIQQTVKGAEIITGNAVGEARIKALSRDETLADYKILHFATHGLMNIEIPELSALVLSQKRNAREDGYLRVGEIAELKLHADFVNLSACETGLGKLYSGEGVFGLTQAFLIAGANGLSVSLWQVADDSTAQFMIALYKMVEEQGMSYARAITEVKRRFIAGKFGEKWKAPYYWAPFVYYGITERL